MAFPFPSPPVSILLSLCPSPVSSPYHFSPPYPFPPSFCPLPLLAHHSVLPLLSSLFPLSFSLALSLLLFLCMPGRSLAAKRFWCIFRLKPSHLLSLWRHLLFYCTFWLCTMAKNWPLLVFQKTDIIKFLRGRLGNVASRTFWPWGQQLSQLISKPGQTNTKGMRPPQTL